MTYYVMENSVSCCKSAMIYYMHFEGHAILRLAPGLPLFAKPFVIQGKYFWTHISGIIYPSCNKRHLSSLSRWRTLEFRGNIFYRLLHKAWWIQIPNWGCYHEQGLVIVLICSSALCLTIIVSNRVHQTLMY